MALVSAEKGWYCCCTKMLLAYVVASYKKINGSAYAQTGGQRLLTHSGQKLKILCLSTDILVEFRSVGNKDKLFSFKLSNKSYLKNQKGNFNPHSALPIPKMHILKPQ